MKPFTCSANRGHLSLYAGYAYDGRPPERSGIIADSSASSRHTMYPVIVISTMIGTDAAPSSVTITGAMPVTRIVPARPITNAPHQFVVFGNPPDSYTSSSCPADDPSAMCPPKPGCS